MTDDYAGLVRQAKAPAGTPDPASDPAHAALTTPYTFARWRADLAAMAAGIPTGFDALEEVGLHWLPGRLYAVIARPGGGKTAFLLEAVMRYLEADPHRTALFLSWEEPVADIVSRLVLREDAHLPIIPGDPAPHLPLGTVLYRSTVRHYARGEDVGGEIHLERLTRAEAALAPKLARLRLVDGDELGRGVAPVLAGVARISREDGAPRFGLVAVDYFQKLRSGAGSYSRQVELQDVSDTLRRFAKGATLAGELEGADDNDQRYAVPVLVAAQVTRGQGEHPGAESIREADDLANDAGAILALSRASLGGDPDDEARDLRLSVEKNRGGRTHEGEVARYAWRPARDWIAPDAVRDGKRVRWEKLDPSPAPVKPGGNGKRATDRPSREELLNGNR